MKKLILSLAMIFVFCCAKNESRANFNTKLTSWDNFYKHLNNAIKYPEKAVISQLQGNSLITFSVSEGKVKDFKIETELGQGCDIEVLNSILSYQGFKTEKSGKYALKVTFKLIGATTLLKNEPMGLPDGFTELKLTITGYAPKIAGAAFRTDSNRFSNSVRISATNDPKVLSNLNLTRLSDSKPLIILDNSVTELEAFTSMDVNRIQTISILKNAESIVSYGEAGKNGVIIITTKEPAKKNTKTETEVPNKN